MLVVMIAVVAGAFVLLTVAARHRMRPAREPEISSWHDGLDALDRIDRRRVRR